MQASWHYKFPHRAQDDVLLLVVSGTACDRLGQSPLQFAQSYLPCVSHDALADQNQGAMHEVGTAVLVRQCTAAKGRGCVKQQSKPAADKKSSSASVLSSTFFDFLGAWRCIPSRPGASIAQVLEEEWGVPSQQCSARVNGKVVSLAMCPSQSCSQTAWRRCSPYEEVERTPTFQGGASG